MSANVIIALAEPLAQLVAAAIARHNAGLPALTGPELAAELQTIQGQWEADKQAAQALRDEGH
jgi:hypothetical protein